MLNYLKPTVFKTNKENKYHSREYFSCKIKLAESILRYNSLSILGIKLLNGIDDGIK